MFLKWSCRKIAYIFVLGLLSFLYYRTVFTVLRYKQNYVGEIRISRATNDIKYILQWTSGTDSPFDEMRVGRIAFYENNCEYNNCYVTSDRNFLPNQDDFDAVAFNAKSLAYRTGSSLPKRRTNRQKYIFVSTESSHYYPICDPVLDNYFNWTWTYRLDSDLLWGYFTVYNLNGSAVGPSVDMKWPEEMKPIDDVLVKKLSTKTKAVAWFVSNCNALSDRLEFAKEIGNELNKYGWTVDSYGLCGKYTCERFERECDTILQRDYYFYLAFENSFAEDYVTEKVLTALHNYAVPIVYGGASYSRFLPNGSYLDAAREGNAIALAKRINEIITKRELYHDFHRWRNHFQFVSTDDNRNFCKLCAKLNNETAVKEITLKKNLREWWNGAFGKC